MKRLLRLARPFPILHAGNAILSLIYSLGQTLVFARSLDRAAFSATIAAITLSFYLLPLNQAVARANFHLIRRSVVAGRGEGGHSEAAAAFHLSQLLMVAVGVVGPLLIPHGDMRFYVALACFAVANNLTNFWYYEVQTTLLAVERPVAFEIVTLLRRLANFAALVWLMLRHDFLVFGVVMLVQALLTQAWVVWDVTRRSDLFDLPRRLDGARVRTHIGLLFNSSLATFAEWLSLNGPYALFTIRFGIGPALIVLDTGLKLLRMVLTVVRNLSEIALPRMSRAVLSGSTAEARRIVLTILIVSSLPAVLVASVLLFQEHLVWRLLLGANNVVPTGAGAAFAVAILASVGFQAGSHLVGHVGRLPEIRLFMITACAGFFAASAYVLLARPEVVVALWAVVASFAMASVAGLWATARTLAAPHAPLVPAEGDRV